MTIPAAMPMLEYLPPAFVLLIGAALIGCVRGALRTLVVLTAPILTLLLVWQVPDGVVFEVAFLDFAIEPIEGSPVRRLFALIFTLMALIGGLYAYRQAAWHELAAAYAYAAGAIGVSFAGDLVTLFIYWEVMAIFSTFIVWNGASRDAQAAGIRYAIMHLLGGVILMIGIEGLAVQTGSIDLRPIRAVDLSTWLILIGVLVNAAAPPVSAWLADAYPRSSPTGSVFLSAFTTKAAVLALILLFPGESVLIGVGLFMIIYGIIYALLENDIRRILAYSIVNQVGFMVCAVGIGTEMALNGAAAHAFAHIIYKALLFMSAGVVVYRTGMNRCSDVGGLFRTMPLTAICGIVGALAISGFPLTSGFTTKTLISQAAAQESMAFVYFMLAAASAGVFLHAGIKFPWFVFFQRDSGLRPKDAPWNMALAMLIFAGLCILLGVAPELLYGLLPYPVEYQAYTSGKVLFYLQLLLFSGLAFFLLLPLMKRTLTISLDTDWLWRALLPRIAGHIIRASLKIGQPFLATILKSLARLRGVAAALLSVSSAAPDAKPSGLLARSWSIGSTALAVLVLLTLYVLAYLFWNVHT